MDFENLYREKKILINKLHRNNIFDTLQAYIRIKKVASASVYTAERKACPLQQPVTHRKLQGTQSAGKITEPQGT